MKRRQFIALAGAAVGGYILLDGLVLELRRFEITKHRMGKGENQIRIVQVSDLHLREYNEMHNNIVQEINKLNPDCVLFTGDMIDRNSNFPFIEQFYLGLNKESVKFGIMGNWEWWSFTKQEKLQELFKKNNGSFLINESVGCAIKGKSIRITGLDDLVAGEPDEQKAFSGYAESDLHLVAAHCPGHIHRVNEIKKTAGYTIDLVLSGHTHGGQVQFFGFAPVLPPGSGRFVSGLYEVEGTKMYVSRGVGTTRIPVRFGSTPEIAVFDFYL